MRNRKRIILIIIGVVYLISPFDFIPDFLLPLGIADDLIVLLFLIKEIFSIIKEKKLGYIPAKSKSRIGNAKVIDAEIVK